MSWIRIALLAALAALVVAAPATARQAAASSTTVTVTMKDFKFVLSKKTVPHGKIVFKLVNKGKVAHDFKIALHKSTNIGPGKSGRLVVTLAKGLRPYKCTIDSHAKLGMKGVLKVT